MILKKCDIAENLYTSNTYDIPTTGRQNVSMAENNIFLTRTQHILENYKIQSSFQRENWRIKK